MPLTVLMDLPRYEEVISAPSAFCVGGEARLVATRDGVTMSMVDIPGGPTAMMSVAAKAGAFREYEYLFPEDEQRFYLPLDKMAAFGDEARKAGGDATILMILNHGDKVVLRSGRVSARASLIGSDPGGAKSLRPLDNASFDLRAVRRIGHGDLKAAMAVVTKLGASGAGRTKADVARSGDAHFRVRDGMLTVSASEMGGSEATVELGEVEPFLGRDITDLHTIIGIGILADVLAALPDRVLEFYVGNDRPIALRFADEHMESLAIIAPKIERED